MLRRTCQLSTRTLSITTRANRTKELKYTKDHYWIQHLEDDKYKVGLSDYAQDSYGDFVVVEIEKMREDVEQDAEIGTVESVKSVATIYAPISGKVLLMNKHIDTDTGRPQLINRDPLGKGWILKMIASNPEELETLFTHEEYAAYLVSEGLLDVSGNPIESNN